jgi:hypothetical protein
VLCVQLRHQPRRCRRDVVLGPFPAFPAHGLDKAGRRYSRQHVAEAGDFCL